MGLPKRSSNERTRELRRRILVPARMRSGAQWSDACILNISSRGLMIQSHRTGPEGSVVELHRGDHVIIARVVWRDGRRAGLQSDERLAVEQIMSLSNSSNLSLVASDGAIIERRQRPRSIQADARSRGRILEFAGTAIVALMLVGGIGVITKEALARPLAQVGAALAPK